MTTIEGIDNDPRDKYIAALNQALPGGDWVACWRELGVIRSRKSNWRIRFATLSFPSLIVGEKPFDLSSDPTELAAEVRVLCINRVNELRRDADLVDAMLTP